MKIGIDLLDVKEFKNKMMQGGQSFLNRHYCASELLQSSSEGLAAVYAAKESIFKTGCLKSMHFTDLQIINTKSGQPVVLDRNGKKIKSLVLSIGRAKDMVIAIALWNGKRIQ